MSHPRPARRRDVLLRLAVRLERLLATAPIRPLPVLAAAGDVLQQLANLSATHRRYRYSHARQWHTACRHLLQQQGAQLRELSYRLSGVDFTPPAPPVRVTARSIVEDLHALEEEFAGFAISDRLDGVSVVTDPIVLEGIALGRFRIELDLSRLAGGRFDGGALSAVALDPNPAAGHDDVTHPHVQSGGICLGEGSEPVCRALREGRLYEVFTITRQVLLSYNEASPYASLDTWSGNSCDDCDRTVPDDDLYCCQECSASVCSRCQSGCEDCDDTFCRSCLSSTDDGDLVCASCLATREEALTETLSNALDNVDEADAPAATEPCVVVHADANPLPLTPETHYEPPAA